MTLSVSSTHIMQKEVQYVGKKTTTNSVTSAALHTQYQPQLKPKCPPHLPFCVSLVEQRKLVIQKDSLVPFRV